MLLRFAPLTIRSSLFYRFFSSKGDARYEYFHQARLALCPCLKMNLLSTDIAHQHIAYTGFFELNLSKKITKLSKSGGLMVDVGANYGYYSLLWAAQNSDNRVIAFEAVECNADAMRENVNINSLSEQITIVRKAAGKKSGNFYFDLGPSSQSTWGGFSMKKTTGNKVDVVTLDEYLSNIINIDVLKIDVEGADTWVLYGAQKLLTEKRISNIFYEQNKMRLQALGIGLDDAQNFLKEMGYTVKNIDCPHKELTEFYAYPQR